MSLVNVMNNTVFENFLTIVKVFRLKRKKIKQKNKVGFISKHFVIRILPRLSTEKYK